jgi:S1-C subfamily serine protease
MTVLTESIRTVSSGVINIVLERDGSRIGSGSAFLIDGYVATASHVIRTAPFDVGALRFDDGAEVRLSARDLLRAVRHESLKEEHDLALMTLDEPEFANRHRFETSEAVVAPGQQVVLLGYPFDSSHLAAHVAYVSSIHDSGHTQILQLDGSANPSNSGGPVIDAESTHLVGWIVRAQTGLDRNFDDLTRALSENVAFLSRPQSGALMISGIDPVQAFRASMTAMSELAKNMKRSANVGIAYANAARHLTDMLAPPP